MKNQIIENRLNHFIAVKKQMLTKKKSERGNQLKEIDATINRLKRWLADPITHIPDPEPEPKRIHFPKLGSTIHAMDAFRTALARLAENQKRVTPEEIREMIQGNNRDIVEQIKHDRAIAGLDHIRNQQIDHGFIWPKKSPTLKREMEREFERMNQIEPSVPISKETPGNKPKTSHTTSKWSNESPEAFQTRSMDVQTAFRRMAGWD